jgi:hypothetical protein
VLQHVTPQRILTPRRITTKFTLDRRRQVGRVKALEFRVTPQAAPIRIEFLALRTVEIGATGFVRLPSHSLVVCKYKRKTELSDFWDQSFHKFRQKCSTQNKQKENWVT